MGHWAQPGRGALLAGDRGHRGRHERGARVTGGRRWTERYPVAKTIWDVYHTERPDLLPTEEGFIPPASLIWIGTMLQHVMRTQAQRIEIRFIARVFRESDGKLQDLGIRYLSVPLTRAEAQSLRPSTEAARRLSQGRKIDAHDEARAVFEALVANLKAGGMADRRARGAARREMQQALGYANPRSLTNLLQPGARRGVSAQVKERLDALYDRLGAPSYPPRREDAREINRADLVEWLEDGLQQWIDRLKHATGPDTDRITAIVWDAVEVRGVRHA